MGTPQSPLCMRNRNIKKSIYLNYDEEKKLKEKCNELNISESEFFRDCISNKEVDYKLRKEILDLIYEIRKIGVNINQLTKIANQSGYISENKYSNNYKELLRIIDYIKEKLR